MTRHRPSGAAARGFTMIELIVVMTLIGLLVSMALPISVITRRAGR